MVKKLVEYIKENYDLNNELIEASIKGDVDKVKEYLDRGADIEAKDNQYGWTPLICACIYNHTEVVSLLINSGAKIDATDPDGYTPLIWACSGDENKMDIVKILLENDADLNAESKSGITPLSKSTLNNHIDIAELLIHNGADINKKTNTKNTFLMVASSENNTGMVELLLSHGSDIHAYNIWNKSCLDNYCEGIWE